MKKSWMEVSKEIKYWKYGNKENPTLLFLHGFGGNPIFYTGLFEKLSETYHILAPKIYGQTYFSRQPYSFAEYLRLTGAFINNQNLNNYYIAGHSYGGLMAMYLGTLSNKIRNVVSMSPMLTTDNLAPGVIHFGKQVYNDIRRNDNKSEYHNLRNNPDIPWAYFENFLNNPYAFMRGSFMGNDADLSKIRMRQPAILYHAEHDMLFKFNSEPIRKLDTKRSGLKIEILKGYGHNWVIYHPEFAAEIIHKNIRSDK